MAYYCTVHKGENQQALLGEKLDACTSHMVADSFYDIEQYQKAPRTNYVIWEMEKDATAKFGYSFKRLYGIPA
jgi:hypothetical protein